MGHQSEIKLRHTSISEVILQANAGSILGEAIQEAIFFASGNWVRVRVLFNDKCWTIDPPDLWAAAKGPSK